MIGETVHVSGKEWPESEWNTPDAWYKGEIVDETKNSVFITFEGESEKIEFTRENLQEYRDIYAAYKFDMLLRAAVLVSL